MLQQIVIGNLGSDAEFKSENGHEFTTFRVAHTDSWNDANGQRQSRTQWIDIIMNGKPNVLPYLRRGTMVCVIGSVSTRVYPSAKDRCWKAGLTINAYRIELLGGNPDPVPRQLFDESGAIHDVSKFYHTDVVNSILMNSRGEQFQVDENGWIFPINETNVSSDGNDEQPDTGTDEVQTSDAGKARKKNK